MAYSSSRTLINTDTVENKDAQLYVKSHETVGDDAHIKARNYVSVGFIVGFLAGGFTCGFLALLFTGYFDV